MSNETKRDVFEDLVEELANAYIALDGEGIGEDLTNKDKQAYLKDYDTALPDDLPVIPKAIGEFLNTHRKYLLGEIFWKIGGKSSAFLDSNELYIVLNSETFVRAWVLGVWRVEETGEIVKLEEEK